MASVSLFGRSFYIVNGRNIFKSIPSLASSKLQHTTSTYFYSISHFGQMDTTLTPIHQVKLQRRFQNRDNISKLSFILRDSFENYIVINVLKRIYNPPLKIAHLVKLINTLQYMLQCPHHYMICHVYREGNRATHYVATKQKACCRYTFLPAGCKAMYAAEYRRALRGMFNLPEEPHGDCLVHECCCVCALTQEYRELKNRGADPSLGWVGNLDKWKQQGIKEPPIPTRMARC